MQLLGVDIVSVYAQLAEDGATFLAVVALIYAVGRLLVVPGARWGLERSRFNRTVHEPGDDGGATPSG